MKSFLLVYFQW